jgi:hypothetical protein
VPFSKDMTDPVAAAQARHQHRKSRPELPQPAYIVTEINHWLAHVAHRSAEVAADNCLFMAAYLLVEYSSEAGQGFWSNVTGVSGGLLGNVQLVGRCYWAKCDPPLSS